MMKTKITLLLYFFIYTKAYCQQLNVMVTVDEIITASYNLSGSYLLTENDSINLDYEMGRFKIKEDDLKKLITKDRQEEVFLNFQYFSNCPVQGTQQYKLKLKLDLLLQNFLLIKVYNYSSYPKTFEKSYGYGFEYISLLESKGLPKRKKIKRNPCYDGR